MAAASCCLGSASAARAEPGCADVYLIGSRGSGQEPAGRDAYRGLGPEVYQFSARLAADLRSADRSYAYLANPYPAVAISPGGTNADGWMWNLAGLVTKLPVGAYDSSVSAGVTGTLAVVRAVIAICPATDVLLAGYSQGAQVAGDAYQQLTAVERTHVLGVFLLADPRRNAADRASDAGSAQVAEGGRAELSARPAFPATRPQRVLSYCRDGDPACEGPFHVSGDRLMLNSDVTTHLEYTTYKCACATYPEQAADYFATLAGAELPSAGPVAVLTPVPRAVTGEPVWISAGGSCARDGSPLSYAWQVGGLPVDGTGDELEVMFPHDGSYQVQVSVIDDHGDSATTTMTISVGGAGEYAAVPGPPTQLTVTTSRDSSTLTWQPPAGGPPAEGYLISTVSGDPLGDTREDEPRSITISDVNLPLRVQVQSVNNAGEGGVSAPVYLRPGSTRSLLAKRYFRVRFRSQKYRATRDFRINLGSDPGSPSRHTCDGPRSRCQGGYRRRVTDQDADRRDEGADSTFGDSRPVWLGRLDKVRNVVRQEMISRQLDRHLRTPPTRILDVGAGQGTQSIRLARAGHQVVSVEPDPDMRAAFRAALEAEPAEVRDRVSLRTGSVGGLAQVTSGEMYDAVLLLGVLMYLPASEPVIAELAAHVGPAGFLALAARTTTSALWRPAARQDWRAALAAFEEHDLARAEGRDMRYLNEIGAPARADSLDALTSAASGLELENWYGVRIAVDAEELDPPPPSDPHELAALLDVEERLGATDPYRQLGQLAHLILRRTGLPPGKPVSPAGSGSLPC
jgi:S-adenosylmethionine-dependent methyltransferase